ncbi:MAG: YbfB/YjiJ family MFS transporter, partial [Spirochaetia bacterium]|nr:YbfB/YjiJ family MFS transporter [Spirochaetia bacterium]
MLSHYKIRIPSHSAIIRYSLLVTVLFIFGMALPFPWLWPACRLLAGISTAFAFVYTSGWSLERLLQLNALSLSGFIYTGPGIGIILSGLISILMTFFHFSSGAAWLGFSVIAALMIAVVWKVFHGDLMNDYQYVMVDLMNIWSQYETVKDGLNYQEVNKEDAWPELKYTLEHKFVKWIPFLKFYSTRMTDSIDPTYKLILIGKMQDPKDPIFMNFLSIPKSKPFPSYKLVARRKNIIKMEGASIQLDDNWNFVEPSPEYNTYHDTYWIKIKSQRDAQIGVETISFLDKFITKDIEHSPYQIASLIISASLMVEPTSVVFQNLPDESLKVSFVVLSPNELYATQCVYKIYKVNKNDYKIINFS